jgi:phytoene synthase
MALQLQAWENTLLTWAYEALDNHSPLEHQIVDSPELQAAYRYCEQVTQAHSRTFHMASSLLPRPQRRAARALYAFCRITDNIVDDALHDDENATQRQLENWRRVISAPVPPPDQPVALAWADAQVRYNIPQGYAQQLIDGVARDLTHKRYDSFTDLAHYSYGVASTVGLMAMHIVGFSSPQAIPYAVKLGVALQMTNILRDVNEDWHAGRVYLPQDELAEFGLSEDDIAAGHADPRWQAFMAFQIERNRRLYAESWPGIAMLDRRGRFAIAAAADLYRAILTDIEQHKGDVFTRRAHVSLRGKVRRLPGIWWRAHHVRSA